MINVKVLLSIILQPQYVFDSFINMQLNKPDFQSFQVITIIFVRF